MSRTKEIREVIARYKGKGPVIIAEFMRTKFGKNTPPEELEDHIEFCHELIEAVPLVIENARAEADKRGFYNWVNPMLEYAEAYFLEPNDLLPEAQFGEFGLLDDAYLAYKIISLIQSERDPLIKVSLDQPISLISQILGEEAVAILQGEVHKAQEKMRTHMRQLQEAASRHASAQREKESQRTRPQTAPQSRPQPAPERRQCGSCSGSGRVTCTSCYGQGYHTSSYSSVDWEGNTEYITENIPCGCMGGYTTCGSCGGSGWL